MSKKVIKPVEPMKQALVVAEAPVEPQVELIKVRSTDGKPFWERHRDHPGGEVWVAGEKVVEVAMTASVHAALKGERLEKVGA